MTPTRSYSQPLLNFAGMILFKFCRLKYCTECYLTNVLIYWTPKNFNYPFWANGKLMVLGVPKLKLIEATGV